MKKPLLLFLLLLVSVLGTPIVRAATDPADRFLDAYFLIQEGDAAGKAGDGAKATTKYQGALEVLAEIKKNNPEWNPHIIEFRSKYCNEHLAEIAVKMPAATPPAPATTEKPVEPAMPEPAPAQPVDLTPPPTPPTTEVTEPTPPPVMPPAPSPEEMAKIKQLQDELDRAHQQIEQLEAARNEVNTKLQEALQKVPATETSPEIEKLLKENHDLAAQLAMAQTQMEELKQAPKPEPVKTDESAELIALRAELGEARAELQRTKDELNQARTELTTTKGELAKSQAEVSDLRTKYDAVLAQLTDANRELSTARQAAQKDNEIIQQLQRENTSLKLMVDRKSISPTPAISPRQSEVSTGPTIPELKGWKPRNRYAQSVKPKPATEPAPGKVDESGSTKLIASVTAPPTASPTPETGTTPATATSSTPENVALIGEAREAMAKNDFATAVTKLNQVIAAEPDNVTALTNLGIVYYRQGKLDDAEPVLRKATGLAPNDSAAHSLLGVVCLRKGQTDAAFTELTRAVALNPRNAEAHNYLGICHSEKGALPAAEKEIRKAIELNPKYTDAHFNLAVIYLKEKPAKIELARVHYKKAIELGAEPDPTVETMLNPGAAKP